MVSQIGERLYERKKWFPKLGKGFIGVKNGFPNWGKAL